MPSEEFVSREVALVDGLRSVVFRRGSTGEGTLDTIERLFIMLDGRNLKLGVDGRELAVEGRPVGVQDLIVGVHGRKTLLPEGETSLDLELILELTRASICLTCAATQSPLDVVLRRGLRLTESRFWEPSETAGEAARLARLFLSMAASFVGASLPLRRAGWISTRVGSSMAMS